MLHLEQRRGSREDHFQLPFRNFGARNGRLEAVQATPVVQQ